MAATLQVTHVSKSYNSPLFEEVALAANSPVRIGLIGDNGSGKSTFLKILAGKEAPDQGEVVLGRDTKIGYLEQEIVADTFDVSGGEKKILRLTELFYSDYDVLLLDEPDNHLDLEHKDWFKNLVKDFPGMIIVISHDRNFLSEGITKTWLVEEKKIVDYSFGYTKFRQIYEQEMASRQHLWEVQEKERLRLKQIVAQLKIWAARNDKIAGRYHSTEKRNDKFVEAMVEKPPIAKGLNIKLNLDEQHKRKTALHIQDLTKSYKDNKVLKGVNLHLFCGEKFAINAPNGSG